MAKKKCQFVSAHQDAWDEAMFKDLKKKLKKFNVTLHDIGGRRGMAWWLVGVCPTGVSIAEADRQLEEKEQKELEQDYP